MLRRSTPAHLGSKRTTCDRGSMEPDNSTSILEGYDLSNRLRRSTRHALDGALRLRTASTQSWWFTSSEPVPSRQPRPSKYCFGSSLRNAVKRNHVLQLDASRVAKADEQWLAV